MGRTTHGPPDGSLEKGDKRITPLVKQNLHYLCRRGSVRYARLCPADLNGLGPAQLGAANTIACIDVIPHAADQNHNRQIEISNRPRTMGIPDRIEERVREKIAKDTNRGSLSLYLYVISTCF